MKIGLTGASGFFGSALAARGLAEGHEILAFSRNDPDGARTRAAVLAAAQGLGLSLAKRQLGGLAVRELDFTRLASELRADDLQAIDVFWHAAAEMSYSGRKLEQSFGQNVLASSELYELLAAHAPRCQRFYYVSTAYTAGLDPKQLPVPEELHLSPRLINVYQASKWGAELSLSLAAAKTGLPLSIFRPSVIIGAEETGWNAGKNFGMYSILKALAEAKQRGARKISLALDPGAQNNIIPVNRVIDSALALSARSGGETLEIFHACAARSFPLADSLGLVSALLSLEINFGPPRSRLDRAIFSWMGQNRIFTGTTWEFSQARLAAALGSAFRPYQLEKPVLVAILGAYLGGSGAHRAPMRPLTRFALNLREGLSGTPQLRRLLSSLGK